MAEWFVDVEVLWAEFEERELSPDAPRIQRTEMRKAFICGYWTELGVLRSIPYLPDDDAVNALVEVLWAQFEKRVLSPGAPRIQRTEMRKAFICGYWTALGVLRSIPDVPDDAAVNALADHWESVSSKVRAMDGAS